MVVKLRDMVIFNKQKTARCFYYYLSVAVYF